MDVRGTVESFDPDRGLGVLRSDDDIAFAFHCVDISDGTRDIAVGARARAERSVGHLGHDEVRRLETF